MKCEIDGCNKTIFVKSRGWCKGHYLRWWRNGDPLGGKFYEHHGLVKTPIYNMWMNIKARCYKQSSDYYYLYGGRGIGMYDPWIDNFPLFNKYIIQTIGEKPSVQHSIDRENPDLGYIPGNLRWATPAQQAANTRSNINGTSKHKGVSLKRNSGNWQAAIKVCGASLYLGFFDDERNAAVAYDVAAIQVYGDYARLNII